MKIDLRKAPRLSKGIPWTSCEPFVENSKATLIHRVRHVTTHQISDSYKPHLAVHAWCGTSFTGTKKFTFLAEPPVEKLVCARCEEVATKRNMEPSDAIAGRHVHLGRTVVVATCCQPPPADKPIWDQLADIGASDPQVWKAKDKT